MIVSRFEPRHGRKSSFAGCLNYALNGTNGKSPGRGELLTGFAVPSLSAAAGAMILEASTSTRCADPVVHTMISFGPGDDVDLPMMRADVARVLKAMGLSQHQHVAILHRDTEWQHVHIIANRVRRGKAVSLWRDFEAVERECTRINSERNWRVVRGHHNRKLIANLMKDNPDLKLAPARTKAERDDARNSHRPTERWGDSHGRAIHSHLAASATMEEFEARLAADGIGLKSQRQGVIFFSLATPEDKAFGCKGSDIALSKMTLDRIFSEPDRKALEDEAFATFEARVKRGEKGEADAVERKNANEAREKSEQEKLAPIHQNYRAEMERLRRLFLKRAARMRGWVRRLMRPRSEARMRAMAIIRERARGIWRSTYDVAVANLKARYTKELREARSLLALHRKRADQIAKKATAAAPAPVQNLQSTVAKSSSIQPKPAAPTPAARPDIVTSPFAAFASSKEHAAAFDEAIRTGTPWHHDWLNQTAQKAWALLLYCRNQLKHGRPLRHWQRQLYPLLHRQLDVLLKHLDLMARGNGKSVFRELMEIGSQVTQEFARG